jgi:hypothetical protein
LTISGLAGQRPVQASNGQRALVLRPNIIRTISKSNIAPMIDMIHPAA